jgi:hypothetical protein
VICLQCQHTAAYHADRERCVVGLVGLLHYQRAYYYCRTCGHGLAPFAVQAGITARQLTPAVERLAALAGAVGHSFERGADLLHETAGVRLSEATVQRTTEDVGDRIRALLDRGLVFGPAVRWAWHRDACGRTVAYFTVDATGTRQQQPGGGKAEGRMAYVAGVYNPTPPEWLRPTGAAPPLRARYLSGLYPLAELGPLLRQQAAHVGMEQADVWIALTDGGNGLEAFCQQNFNRPDLVVILDFYHAAEYLKTLARTLHPQQEDRAKEQGEQWCRLLKAEGGAATLAVLRAWAWPARRSAALRASGRRWRSISRTIFTGWNTRSMRRRVGKSAAGWWRAPARRWWRSGSKVRGCAGVKRGRMLYATCGRCTAARRDNGRLFGAAI